MSEEKLKCPSTGIKMHWREDGWIRPEDVWNHEWRPRTCSQCGCIHPDDLIKLLDEGWEVGQTNKSYKAYLNPPGYSFAHKRFHQQLKDKEGPDPKAFEEAARVFDGTWTPTPPVKVYTWHMSNELTYRLNQR